MDFRTSMFEFRYNMKVGFQQRWHENNRAYVQKNYHSRVYGRSKLEKHKKHE
jgi:hypothetical protein